jgi:glycosyltransferase involved in cell wall biosynthesis
VATSAGIGPAKARNAGIALANAPLVAFLDADDWWWPKKLAAQIAYHAAHPETAFSFANYLQVSASGDSLGACFEFWRAELLQRKTADYLPLVDALPLLLATNLVGTSTVVASRAALEKAGGFGDLPSAEDWDLWLRLVAEFPVACSKSVTTTYLVRAGSASSSREARIAATDTIIRRYEGTPIASVRHAAGIARARLDVARAELAQSEGRLTLAAAYHASAFMAHPCARTGKAATASVLNAARQFLGGQAASR